ncbi:MAG: DinB family protein, partial [Caldilineaceae bacterium]|nr:DinB family protein [Caldilineaceae bacterium]
MTEPLVTQLRFTRSELARCLQGVSAEDAQRRLKPMNSISWLVGHLASQEQFLWLERAQGTILSPELYRLVG